MTALIILLAIAAPQQASQSLYSKIIRETTGQNGYEEYVMAADRAIAAGLREAVGAIEIDDGESTRLSRIKIVVDKSNDIARLISTGNRKRAYYPNAMNFETLLPELGWFRVVSRALVARVEWQFSQGRPNDAIETTVDILRFANGVAGAGPIIHYLVGTGHKTIALAVLFKHRARIALPGTQTLERFAIQSLNQPSPLLRALSIEFRAIMESLDSIIDDPILNVGFRNELTAHLESLPDARLQLVRSETKFAITKIYEARMDMLAQPETAWEELSQRLEDVARPADDVAQALVEMIQPMFTRVDQHEIARRAQLRLLILHAAIIEYRWTHGKWTYGQLPTSLSDLDVPISIIDPLTGEPFRYELVGEEYDLYSEGTPGTGRIDLNWRASFSNNELAPPSLTTLSRAFSSTTSATRLGTP